MIENPVRSPMVPPMADNISTNFAALSLEELVDGVNFQTSYFPPTKLCFGNG